MAKTGSSFIWKAFGLPEPVLEHKFWPKRRFRFDYAWPDYKIAVEIEGGVWIGGRHTRGAGFIKDMEKYNYATKMGWMVFRFTPQQLLKGEACEYIRFLFKKVL